MYIETPQLSTTVSEQRYTCLEVSPAGVRYRFESLENEVSGFTAELQLDSEGLVVDYPALFRRVGVW